MGGTQSSCLIHLNSAMSQPVKDFEQMVTQQKCFLHNVAQREEKNKYTHMVKCVNHPNMIRVREKGHVSP